MKWDLSVLYTGFGDQQMTRDFDDVLAAMADIEAVLDGDGEAGDKLARYAAWAQSAWILLEKLSGFAQLTLATDATNEQAEQAYDRVMQQFVRAELISARAVRLAGALTDEQFDALLQGCPELAQARFAFVKMRASAKHLLPETVQELALNMSLTGADAFSQLRDKLDATLLVDYRGEKLPLSAVRAKAEDPDPAVRRDAYLAELAAYPQVETPMAAALNAIKGEGLTLLPYKKFDSILDETLFDSNMESQTLEAMWTACREFLPVFRKYLRKKGELLGHKDGLPFYDLFAPVGSPDAPAKTYTVEEARALLVREMSKFTPEMGAFIDNAFESRWIDMYPREGKRGGAFCAGLEHCEQSRILTNFAGSFGDVSTLAHELGHAWHNRCMEGMPMLLRGTPMPLAETASIFNETLLANAARQGASPDEQFTLLESELQNSTQVIVDIYSRFLFESAVIKQRKSRSLSINELKTLMLDAQAQSYGDGLDAQYRHPYMWACKSHYYIPGLGFYNFPYAFGLLFGKGVYALYQREGASFVPKYNQLLRACGSGDIVDVAASVGIDVNSVDFWRASLGVIEQDIEQFMRMADERLGK